MTDGRPKRVSMIQILSLQDKDVPPPAWCVTGQSWGVLGGTRPAQPGEVNP